MKKYLKILFLAVGMIVICLVVDIVSIYTMFKPIFGIKKDCICKEHLVYKGIIYDTYCIPECTLPRIKSKWYVCEKSIEVIGNGKVIDIVDKTQKIKDFVCAEALEGFFEDENYQYFFSCIKGKYIIVKYENGYEETVENALKRGTITVQDLDLYGIGYIKYEKR